MRTGIFISAVSHVVLVAFALLGTPKLFESVPLQTIEVDLVRAQELEPEPPKEPEKKPLEKPADWNPLPEASAAQARPSAPEASAAQEQPATKEVTGPPRSTKQSVATQQARAPQPPTDSPAQTPQQPSPQQPSIFDPANIPTLMNIPNAPSGFDFEATVTANISADERAAFKAHLRKCWKLPDGLRRPEHARRAAHLLKRDGALAAEPMLIEASASREGRGAAGREERADGVPALFVPPPDKYREWQTLDVSFTPQRHGGRLRYG